MKGIIKQYVFLCSDYWQNCGNCANCSARSTTVVADSEQEAIEKFKKCGGKVDLEKEKIKPPDTFCELMNFFDD